ncbi:MAG: hypothetical protein ISS46_03925 [Candidatus Omnitrophica bacterium]|nr:hypothetical protein [Candidatus Omnitrophota bacterium]
MKVKHHIIVSLSGGVIIWLITQSFFKAILFSFAGIFIDVDHLFDYVRNWGWKIMPLRNFFNIFYTLKLKKIYVLLHGYELLAMLGLLLWYLKVDWGWVVFLSLAIHLLMDQIYCFTHFRRNSPWFYFLTYRISKGFESERFLKIKF